MDPSSLHLASPWLLVALVVIGFALLKKLIGIAIVATLFMVVVAIAAAAGYLYQAGAAP